MTVQAGRGGVGVTGEPGAIPPPSPVVSVFGRIGPVIAQAADYAASLISNDSGVVGATVKDALNTLAGAIASLSGAIPAPSTTTPADVAAAGAIGIGTTYARADHAHKGLQLTSAAPQSVGTANAVGTATDSARADHVHAGLAVTASAPVNVTKSAAAVGTATDAARSDHKHDVATAAPVSVGTANSEGTSASLARADHVHAGLAVTASAPVNVTKAAAAVGTATDAARSDHKHDVATAAPVSVGTANSEGTSTSLARADHVHVGALVTSSAPQSVGAVNAVGTATDAARADHVHAGITLTAAPPANVTKASAAVGTATDAARSDHKHDVATAAPVSVGTANSEGTSASLARADHVHVGALVTSSAPVNVTKSAAAVGTATDAARSDHKHDVATAVPVAVGTTLAEGTSTSLARADHVHTASGRILQSTDVAVSGSATTSSSSYATLLTQAITLTAGSVLLLDMFASWDNNAVLSSEETYFQITINGTVWRSVSATTGAAQRACAAIAGRVAIGSFGLVAGANTILLRWRRTGSTSTINSASDGQGAALRLIEQSA